MENGDMDDGNGNGSNKLTWIIVTIVIILIIIGIIAAIAFAFSGGDKEVGESCDNGSQCGDNLVCQNRNNPNASTNKVCLAQTGGKCSVDSGCVFGSNCVNKVCS